MKELIKAINAHKIIDFDPVLGYGNRQALQAGKYRLSIQGSSTHYCMPRQLLFNAANYSRMEMAIFNKNGWFDVSKSSIIRKFPRWGELSEYYDGPGKYCVFGYVPMELLSDFYLYLKSKS